MERQVNLILRYHKKGNITTEEAQDKIRALFGVRYCATQMKNILCNRFTKEAKKHVGKKIDEVPELAEMLKAIEIVESIVANVKI